MAELPEEFDYEALGEAPLWANMVAGAFAGIMEHTVMYPIDAIKTRMQILQKQGSEAAYESITSAITKISAAEGGSTLWRGMSSVVMGAGPAHAVYFGTYEVVKESLGGNVGDEHHPFVTAFAGACATTASDALMNPFDVIKQRMQVENSIYRSVRHCAADVYRKEGFSAFYVSYPTTLTMTIPATAINFAAYESLKKILNPSGRYDPLSHILCGGLAGASAAALTTPNDVIKTLLQTRGNSDDPRIRQCSTFKEAAQIIYQREGARGFWKGLRPRVVSNFPSAAICWASYEFGKRLYKTFSGDDQTPVPLIEK